MTNRGPYELRSAQSVSILITTKKNIIRKFPLHNSNILFPERGCLYEMSLLLTCLEENEFEDRRCVPQLKALNQCYKIYSDNIERARSVKEQTVPVPNSKNFTHKQITYLLRRYPVV